MKKYISLLITVFALSFGVVQPAHAATIDPITKLCQKTFGGGYSPAKKVGKPIGNFGYIEIRFNTHGQACTTITSSQTTKGMDKNMYATVFSPQSPATRINGIYKYHSNLVETGAICSIHVNAKITYKTKIARANYYGGCR